MEAEGWEVTGTQVECGGGLQGREGGEEVCEGPLGERVLGRGGTWPRYASLAAGKQGDSRLCPPDRLLLRGLLYQT